MFYHIFKILYKPEWNWDVIWKVADSILIKIIGLPIMIGDITALEVAVIAGHEAFAIKPAIAASMVRTTVILLRAHSKEKWVVPKQMVGLLYFQNRTRMVLCSS